MQSQSDVKASGQCMDHWVSQFAPGFAGMFFWPGWQGALRRRLMGHKGLKGQGQARDDGGRCTNDECCNFIR